jgi:hypothetical protein
LQMNGASTIPVRTTARGGPPVALLSLAGAGGE